MSAGIPEDTLEHWALEYIASESLTHKLAPPAPPEQPANASLPRRVHRPGRPPELRVVWDKYKAPKSAHALRAPEKRAHLVHTFLHHELQAAELMCWAVLAFPETPAAFKRGLVRICMDEIRHMSMYQQYLRELGYDYGAFAVRDWFWERAPAAQTPAQFVALMGLGFEAGNLDHTARFAAMFRAAGDARGAELQATVGNEEISHVAFGAHWFRQFSGPLSFARWTEALPPPLSPMVMRGNPLDRAARLRAGLDATFLDELSQWQPQSRGC